MRTRVLLFLLITIQGRAQDANPRLEQIIQSYVTDHKFMGSVLLAKGDTVLLSRGYGSANLEWDIPNTPTTKFRLGSITKQFTAACILLLEERGKWKVSDPVKKYMPDAPAAWDKITIFHFEVGVWTVWRQIVMAGISQENDYSVQGKLCVWAIRFECERTREDWS